MVKLKDLIITQYGTNQPDQIIDSYDLIKGILTDLEGQANFNIKLDTTLPLIHGDPKHLTLLFKDFIRKAIELFSGQQGEIKITHIKNDRSWIFAFFREGFQHEATKNPIANLVEPVHEFNMAISKKTTSSKQFYHISLEH